MKIIKIGAIWCPACIITGNALKKLQKEHEKAMEAIRAFTKEAKGLENAIDSLQGK